MKKSLLLLVSLLFLSTITRSQVIYDFNSHSIAGFEKASDSDYKDYLKTVLTGPGLDSVYWTEDPSNSANGVMGMAIHWDSTGQHGRMELGSAGNASYVTPVGANFITFWVYLDSAQNIPDSLRIDTYAMDNTNWIWTEENHFAKDIPHNMWYPLSFPLAAYKAQNPSFMYDAGFMSGLQVFPHNTTSIGWHGVIYVDNVSLVDTFVMDKWSWVDARSGPTSIGGIGDFPTGVHVVPGDTIHITATGMWWCGDTAYSWTGPASNHWGSYNPPPILPDIGAGALVGGIGVTSDEHFETPFVSGDTGIYGPGYVGKNFLGIATHSGQIYLAINDEPLNDNEGGFYVTIAVTRFGNIQSGSHSYRPGWSMIGFPLETIPEDSVFSLGSATYLYGYSGNGGYFASDSLALGQGYWLGASSPLTASVTGIQLTDSVGVPLNLGFNIISLPYYVSSYSKDGLFVGSGSTLVSLDSAVSLGWVSPVLYSYQSTVGNYSAFDTLTPWNGYWFAAIDSSLELVFEPPTSSGPPSPSVQKLAALLKENLSVAASDSNWYVGLTLSANKSVDRLGGFGVKPGAKSGFDAGYDLPHPPNPPTSDYVYLVFPHPEWGSVIGPNFSADVRAPGNPISWNLTAGFAGKTTTAVLTWDSTGVPAGATIQLSDLGNKSAKVNMKKAGSYRFTINGTDSLTITSVLTAVTQQPPVIPTAFALRQNYPNPFNPATIISYDLPKGSRVVLAVYDDLGRKVRTLVDQEKPAGSYQVVFDASNLPSGVYFYKITAGTFTAAKKLMLVK